MNRYLSLACTTVVAAALLVLGEGVAAAAPGFQMPFPCGQVWSGQTRSDHSPANAVDFNRTDDLNDPVVASAGGTVSRSESEGDVSYGQWIEIDHGSGWRTRYAHLSVRRVSVGQSVSIGQLIGNVGSTGGSSGPHLHFEQRLNGVAQKIVFNGSQIFYWGTRSYTSNNRCGGGNPYTPQEVCGSGYSVIDSAALGTSGRTYLLYNSGNGYNCVATIKSVNIGTASAVSAFLEVAGGTRTTDSGSYKYYAGPVKRSAPGKCVKWGGSVGSASYASPFEHCG
ncbi:Peptidase family M23 [Actinokineospora alba]|uniref:Peptidase family M23 n=1 Tax=Actinokineospora alba TaxID=504798 RepID=A0A1H0JF56_9PSEU|nr:M23 family metallopeptidase [Actinokineospora alba]TDP68315.1 peptidase M23-like protein [Actinokineospora alba]SDH96702.1 Peptidase family M23 [Actinokineospora alba]SDO42274.1 Peptidase family M23 [Actinokineospora alba]